MEVSLGEGQTLTYERGLIQMANDMFAVVVETVNDQTVKANAIAEQVAAATVDSKALVHEIRDTLDTVTDEKVLKYRETFERAMAEMNSWTTEIDEYIKANLLPTSNGDVDVDALKEQYKELKSTISAAKTFVSKLPGYDENLFANTPELKTLRGGTSSGGGTGGKRPRLESIWVGDMAGNNFVRVHDVVKDEKKGTERDVSNFTLAARFIGNKEHANCKVEVKDLQAAAFAAAKTDDLSTLAGKVFEFVYSPDGGKNSYTVKVQPKDVDAADTNTPAATSAAE